MFRQWIERAAGIPALLDCSPANVSYGGCVLLFRNVQVLSCWRVRAGRCDQPRVNRFACNRAMANPRRLQAENPLIVLLEFAKPTLFEARKLPSVNSR
ncbi:MAG: hypothetical protein DLM68_15205 [Hyphomicrobiales bacterium]|nr:MAG: hypothetical protein DLM68_15205 [Hyphomicrobiales bacterium]